MNFDNIQPRPVICRQSSIACAMACKRKWFCKYRLGIVLRGGEYKEAADLGRVYHHFQELGPGHDEEVRAWVRGLQTKLMDQVDRGEDIDGNLQRTAEAMTHHFNKARAMAHLFWERFPQPDHLKTIGTEIKHSCEFYGLILEGTIDKLLMATIGDSGVTDGVWIRDHKSTGRSLAAIFGGLGWSLQGRIYRILAEDYCKKNPDNLEIPAKFATPSANIRGFILDGILKPTIKLCRTDIANAEKWGCTEDEAYLRRVKAWYEEKEKDAMDSRAMIFTEPLYPKEMEEPLETMKYLAEFPIDPEKFDRDVTRRECYAYEKQCPYHSLCETPVSMWDELFETKYKIEEPKEDDTETTKSI